MLKQRGLVFTDEAQALHLLRNISYYRLSGYWYPLLADKQNHLFKPGSTFDAAYNIYKFDSELRKLIITKLEKIEVAVRTQTAYILSSQWDGYCFADTSHFNNPVRHAKILSKLLLSVHCRFYTIICFPEGQSGALRLISGCPTRFLLHGCTVLFISVTFAPIIAAYGIGHLASAR